MECKVHFFLYMLTKLTYNSHRQMREWAKEDIRDLRSRLGLSQTAFGELVGITRIAVYYLEKGVRRPSRTLAILMEHISQHHSETKTEKEGKKHE